jgi:membrane fusion protein (multidrug efflux system)
MEKKKMVQVLNRKTTVILLAAILTACGGDAQKSQGNSGGPPALEVEVVTLVPSQATITHELPGRLQAVRTAQVRARVEGIVERRLFVEGSDVRSGATLFSIDPRGYQATFDAAMADVAVARLTFERYKPLLDIKAVSQQELDLANAKVKQTEAVLTRARLDLENTTVPAPISGRIGRAAVTEGALVGRGEATLLATIEQIDPIYANFTRPGVDLLRLQQAVKSGKLKQADHTRVELIREDGSIYAQPGKLQFSDLAIDPATGSVSLRAVFANPGHELLPGAFVRVRFPEAVLDAAIRVPQSAVLSDAQGQFVMVVDGTGKAVQRLVKTDGMSGDDFIVAEGLKRGDRVIVNGLQKLRPGVPMKPLEWKPNAPPAARQPASERK